ncbi:MAG: hypothetical protein K2K52_00120 [Paramuribaculum sp.]|nr:hypothetical protein [Paramuribaculum sp.]
MAAVLVAMVTYGTAAVMFNNLLTPWWMPTGWAFSLSLLSFVLMPGLFRIVTDSGNRWLNGIVHSVVITGVFLCSITLINRVGIDSRPNVTVEAQIVRTYQTTHYTTRRLSRNTYVKGSPYQMYHVVVQFPGGKEKNITVPRSTYTRLSRKRHIEVTLIRGLLGMEIIKGI